MIATKVSNKVAGVILAGGLASRMGGGDKSLNLLGKKTILENSIIRLSAQVGKVALNANGDPGRFAKFKVPVIHDHSDQFLGPLAGILSGLNWAHENGFGRIVTVAADTPFFPLTLVKSLCESSFDSGSNIAIAATKKKGSELITRHPTFGLWPVFLRTDLRKALDLGVRRVIQWAEIHDYVEVLFNIGEVDPFFNVNTHEDLNIAQLVERKISSEVK